MSLLVRAPAPAPAPMLWLEVCVLVRCLQLELQWAPAGKIDIAAYIAFAVQIVQQLPPLLHPHLPHFHLQEAVCLESSLLGPPAPQALVPAALRQLLGPVGQGQLQQPGLEQLRLTRKDPFPRQLQQPQLQDLGLVSLPVPVPVPVPWLELSALVPSLQLELRAPVRTALARLASLAQLAMQWVQLVPAILAVALVAMVLAEPSVPA